MQNTSNSVAGNETRTALPGRMHPDWVACTTERLNFHWAIWSQESKEFWRRVTWCSIAILLTTFYQTGTVTLSISWLQVESPEDLPIVIHVFLFLLCSYLLGLMGFSFVDLMRHRVPDVMEPYIHNNFLPKNDLSDKSERQTGVKQGVELLEGLTAERVENLPKEVQQSVIREKYGTDLRRLGRFLYRLVYVYFALLGAWLVYVLWFVIRM